MRHQHCQRWTLLDITLTWRRSVTFPVLVPSNSAFQWDLVQPARQTEIHPAWQVATPAGQTASLAVKPEVQRMSLLPLEKLSVLFLLQTYPGASATRWNPYRFCSISTRCPDKLWIPNLCKFMRACVLCADVRNIHTENLGRFQQHMAVVTTTPWPQDAPVPDFPISKKLMFAHGEKALVIIGYLQNNSVLFTIH